MSTNDITAAPKELDAGMMVRRALFLLALAGTLWYFLVIDFKGLSHSKGMDQAQIARQIADKGTFSTLCVRPLCYAQVEKVMKGEKGDTVAPPVADGMPDTLHAPLNPLLNSLALGMAKDAWEFEAKQRVYTPDYIIAGVSMVLLLVSIAINYLLITRIFDAKIGGVVALLMLVCESLWHFSQSGLPHMLMLFLFSFGMYFLYKAMENNAEGKPVTLWIALTGGFFGLLALAHWLAVWPFLGLAVFVALYFNPRGVQMLALVGSFALITIWWPFLQNAKYSGNPLGAGIYLFYAGLAGSGDEVSLMRDYEQTMGGLRFDGFITKIVGGSLLQLNNLFLYLGGVLAAPIFFLSLLHPFRRREIADLRWCILVMWLASVVGMTLYGISSPGGSLDDRTDSNNLHLLFIPLMSAYGLAMLAVLWNRLSLPLQVPMLRNAHYFFVILVSAIPLSLKVVQRLVVSTLAPEVANTHYPAYLPSAIAEVAKVTNPNEAVASDIPWAVAWYANRASFLMPKNKPQLEDLRNIRKNHGEPITAALISSATTGQSIQTLLHRDSFASQWKEYAGLYVAARLVGAPAANALLENMPFRYPVGFADDGYANAAFLLLTESPFAAKENK